MRNSNSNLSECLMRFSKPSLIAFIIVVAVHMGLIAFMLQAAAEPKAPSFSAPTIQGVIVQAQPKAVTPPKPPKPKPLPTPKPKVEPKPQPKPKSPVAPPSERAVKAPEPPPEPIKEVAEVPTPAQEPVAPVSDATPTAATGPVSDVVLPSSDAGHLRNRAPNYPSLSRRLREEGIVLLEILVRADGSVGEIKLKESSGFKRLDDAALKAVANWKFMPATQNGTAIDYWYEQPLEFNLH